MRPLDPVAPDVLADLMLASALAGHAEVVAMCSGAEHCAVMLETGGKMFAGLWVPVEVGEAVAARLSSAAGIALRLGGGDARGDVVRLAVRAGGRTGLVVLSMGMPGEGSRVEIRRLASYGGHVTALKRCTRCGAFQPPQRVACDTDGAPLADVAEDPVVGGTIGAYCVGAL